MSGITSYSMFLEEGPSKIEVAVTTSGTCAYSIQSKVHHATLRHSILPFLEINVIESLSSKQLKVTTYNSNVMCFSTDKCQTQSADILNVMTEAVKAYATVFPMVPLESLFPNLKVQPSDRLKILRSAHQEGVTRATRYAADETDEDDPSCSHAFSLKKFNERSNSNSQELLSVLERNTWFTSFNADGVKLTPDAFQRITRIIKASRTLKEIDLSDTGLQLASVREVSAAIRNNQHCKFTSLILSRNQLNKEGLEEISATLFQLNGGLRKLELEDTDMKISWSNDVLFPSLNRAATYRRTLLCLNLGGLRRTNPRPGRQFEPIENLISFLESKNVLEELNLRDGGADLTKLITAIYHGCRHTIRFLNLSGNVYSEDPAETPHNAWKSFFNDAPSLVCVRLSKTALSLNALRDVLDGLSRNNYLAESGKGINLDVSHNSLGTQGRNTWGDLARNLKNVHSFDLTGNGLENELTHIFSNLVENRSVKHLSIGQNFSFARAARFKDTAIFALIRLFSSGDTSSLESIDISNSRLGRDTSKILCALRNNTQISKLNLSGNCMGDALAAELAGVLQNCPRLTWLSFDCNDFSIRGLRTITDSMKTSGCTRYVEVPNTDITQGQHEDEYTALSLKEIFLQQNKAYELHRLRHEPKTTTQISEREQSAETYKSIQPLESEPAADKQSWSYSENDVQLIDLTDCPNSYDKPKGSTVWHLLGQTSGNLLSPISKEAGKAIATELGKNRVQLRDSKGPRTSKDSALTEAVPLLAPVQKSSGRDTMISKASESSQDPTLTEAVPPLAPVQKSSGQETKISKESTKHWKTVSTGSYIGRGIISKAQSQTVQGDANRHIESQPVVSTVRPNKIKWPPSSELQEDPDHAFEKLRMGFSTLTTDTFKLPPTLKKQGDGLEDGAQPAALQITPPTSEQLRNFRFHFDAEMMGINKEIEMSSYRLQQDDQLLARPKRQGQMPALLQRLQKLVEDYGVAGGVIIDVKPEPVVAKFCHILDCGGYRQNVGMYVKESGIAYWLSTAHGVLRNVGELLDFQPVMQGLHNGERDPIKFFLQMPSGKHSEEKHFCMPTPFVIYSATGYPQSKDQLLYHGIDIMVGQTPWIINDNQHSEFPVATLPHLGATSRWHSLDIYALPESPLHGGIFFDATELNGKNLKSFSSVTSEILEGSVSYVNCNVRYDLNMPDSENEIFKNCMFIRPTCKVKPREGHSGSVWVISEEDSGKKKSGPGKEIAVAITSAICEEENRTYWVVSPLCSSLYAIKKTYPHVFPERSEFRGVGVYMP